MDHTLFPPLAAIINFIALVVLIIFAVRKPFKSTLHARHHQWKTDVEEAETLRVRTEDLLSKTQKQMESLQDDVSRIFEEARQSAEKEKQHLLYEAKLQAEKMIQDAQKMADVEKKLVEKKLRQEIIAEAIRKAKVDLSERVGSSEHRVFVESLIEEAEAHRV